MCDLKVVPGELILLVANQYLLIIEIIVMTNIIKLVLAKKLSLNYIRS